MLDGRDFRVDIGGEITTTSKTHFLTVCYQVQARWPHRQKVPWRRGFIPVLPERGDNSLIPTGKYCASTRSTISSACTGAVASRWWLQAGSLRYLARQGSAGSNRNAQLAGRYTLWRPAFGSQLQAIHILGGLRGPVRRAAEAKFNRQIPSLQLSVSTGKPRLMFFLQFFFHE